jgi:PAS domain S-box-containing protein
MAERQENISFKSNNELYHRMIEEIQDYAIILLDRNGFIQNWNKGAEKIKLYTEAEATGKHFSMFYLEEDLARNLPSILIEEARQTGRAGQEGWRKRKDGTRFWGSITITALHDDDNNVIGFSKVTRDLTDKKMAEDFLKMSEERYHQMIAEVQDYAIILLNEHGIIENWNAGAQNIKGYRAAEVVGKKFEIFYTPEDRENKLPDRLLDEARKTGKAVQEGWRVRKDGTRFWGTIVITALHGKNNEIIGFSKVTRDLTQKKLDDQRLLAYTAELEIQNNELEQFAYVASHDLQNYLDEAFVKKYFTKLDQSAKRMGLLIKSLLNYSRLAKDKSEIDDVDLNVVLDEIKQDFELMIEEKHAVITSEKLPIIKGNHIQLGQLFANLISNSLKFSEKNTRIKISSAVVTKDQIPDAPPLLIARKYLQINFEDNGIGFEQQYEKVIFSLFQRLHGKQDYAGTGIGLALCKKIVENHNGYITATGELNKGAKFMIYLPIDK